MKKKLVYSIVVLLISVVDYSQTNVKTLVNDPNAEKRQVGNFTGIQVSNAVTLYLSQGNEDAVAVSCSKKSDNNKIKTEVVDGVLKIYLTTGAWNIWDWKDFKVNAYVSTKIINLLKVSGASTVKISDMLTTDKLKLDVSGASSIKGYVIADEFVIKTSGASSVSLTGNAKLSKIEVSGASSFKGYEFNTVRCFAEARGASSINISVSKELSAEANGASNIKYTGNPNILESNATGASSIKKKL
jgi:hypothetical protein